MELFTEQVVKFCHLIKKNPELNLASQNLTFRTLYIILYFIKHIIQRCIVKQKYFFLEIRTF